MKKRFYHSARLVENEISGLLKGKLCQLPNAPEARKERWCQSFSASHIAWRADCSFHRPTFSRPALMFLRCVHLRACCRACWYVLVYSSSSVNKFWANYMQMREDSSAWFSKWLETHSGGDLPLKLSVNADLKVTKAKDSTTRKHGREHRLPVIA